MVDNLKFMVGGRGDKIVIIGWGKELSKSDALELAAWLVALADPGGKEFKRVLDEVLGT